MSTRKLLTLVSVAFLCTVALTIGILVFAFAPDDEPSDSSSEKPRASPKANEEQKPAAATQVLKFAPWSGGEISSKLTMADEQSGTCTSASVAGRSDSYRCFSTASRIIDPCFADPEADTVVGLVCPHSSTEATFLHLSQELDEPPTAPSGDNAFWMVRLSDGTPCQAVIGASPQPIDEKPFFMGCSNPKKLWDSKALWGEINTDESVWTVHMTEGDSEALKIVEIAAVYR